MNTDIHVHILKLLNVELGVIKWLNKKIQSEVRALSGDYPKHEK